jgi:hypothetical protein
MMTRLLALALLAAAVTGCALDPHRHDRRTRLLLGANTRHFQAPISNGNVAFRDTAPPPAVMTTSHEAVAATANFTVNALSRRTYVGGELEAGMLTQRGSSTGAAYGIFGYDHPLSIGRPGSAIPGGSFGAELATGWRTVRYSIETDDYAKIVVEPRLRAQVWLSEYISLAATAGMTVGEQAVFMGGISVGVHSHVLGTRP